MSGLFKIFAVCLICQSLCSQWFPQVSGTNYPIRSVHFINENTGLACSINQVLKTTNSGANWFITSVPGSHRGMCFVNASTGFICSDSGRVYKTTDTGNSWNSSPTGTLNILMSVSFINSQTGIICGFGKTVLKTTNGGTNWFSIAGNIITENDFLSTKMLDANTYFVSGYGTYILKTINGGNSWAEHTHNEPNPFFGIEFIDNNTGWATGCCGMFMNTTDGGTHWETMYYLTLGFTLYTIKYINSNTGYTCGDIGIVYRTTNRGASWDSTLTGGTLQSLFSIDMVNENTGWVVGGYGTILKTTNGGGPGFTIGIQQISSEVPKEFYLSQNYPNPFNPETRINFQVSEFGNVTIKIFDITGKEVSTLVNESLHPGTYEVNWNASSYPSGVYFYTIRAGNFSISKKMILAK